MWSLGIGHLLPTLILTLAAPGPFLMPFTLNFTITNLPYEEAMDRPSSPMFSKVDGNLQQVVRPHSHHHATPTPLCHAHALMSLPHPYAH